MIEIVERQGCCAFSVRVQPRSRRDGIEGEHGGALKVRLTAPPVDDQANHALRRLLADELKIPVAAVRILAGQRSRNKRVEVRGVAARQIQDLAAE